MAGIVCGLISFVFVPILFGPLGTVLGVVGAAKGDRALGVAAAVLGFVGLVVGVVFSFLLLSATNGS